MKKIDRFIVWLCKKFTRAELETIIAGLLDVLANRNPDVKPRDDFKEKHPNYRNFSVDPNPPLLKQQTPKEQEKPVKNWPLLPLLSKTSFPLETQCNSYYFQM